jgi:phosphoserine phosphatase RsbU/P
MKVAHPTDESQERLPSYSPESYVLFSQVMEQIADGVMITDSQGRIEYVNPAFEGITGYSQEDVLGGTPRILGSGLHDAEFFRQFWKDLQEARSFRGTLINRKKTGATYYAEQSITPIVDETGNVTHFVSVMHDATDLLKKQEREVQLRLARQVQDQFYRPAPAVPGFDVAAAAYPAYETSGDYFDFIPMPQGSLCIAVGDVEGHGFGSALVMALTRAYVRSFATVGLEVDQILTEVNRTLAGDLVDGCFVTLALACLDTRKRSLVFAGAGHVPGYLLYESGEVAQVLESTGPPLGLFAGVQYSRGPALQISSGQLVVLLTDGITEASTSDGPELGAKGALECIRTHRNDTAMQIVESLYRRAREFAPSELQSDDITSVILKANPELKTLATDAGEERTT